MAADLPNTLRRMPTSPGPLLAALDVLWDRLRTRVPRLPDIRPTVSPAKSRQDHGPQRWTRDADGVVTGLVVTADVLREGPDAVLTHVLHEAAHVLNWVEGRDDVTMRGAYHNGVFLAAAEEVGLEWPDGAQRVAGRGFVNPVLSAATRQMHREDITALAEAIPRVLPHMALPTSANADRRTDRLTLRCRCDPPRSFRISRTVAAQGPIVCGVCSTEFAEA